MMLIASERPSASCSITRNFALAPLNSATNWSNTSAATNHLLRQELQRFLEARHLAVGRGDGGVDGAAMALLDHLGHQRIDAGLAQRLADQPHLLPAPVGVHDVGLHQHADEVGEAAVV